MGPKINNIPVIDIFAGPGGLGEGFTAYSSRGLRPFHVGLSIEKDRTACDTLLLRKVFRQWRTVPDEFESFARGELTLDELKRRFPDDFARAEQATWCAELGVATETEVETRILRVLKGEPRYWVLIGGPPCQAYSLVGRSRMRGYHDFEKDKRHFLYQEYLRIVAVHRPAVFVMENVKGILSSTIDGERIFQRILNDLRRPAQALKQRKNGGLEYRLYGLGKDGRTQLFDTSDLAADFVVRSEDHGIPQARHRVFVVGVRSDIEDRPEALETNGVAASMRAALSDLPALRSQLSDRSDTNADWLSVLDDVQAYAWMKAGRDSAFYPVAKCIRDALRENRALGLSPGSRYRAHRGRPKFEGDWYRSRASGITHHEARSHMRTDLHRYLFAAAFAKVNRRSPRLRDFPTPLLPHHRNVDEAVKGSMFGDRFRVQLPDAPSSTITSHLAKDGHYFIHFDPAQCRSLTVREAARLQTFPDDYFFVGNRTERYVQVGNAVPPLLARQVAGSVYRLLRRAMRSRR